jgi:hypothetical protein
MTIVRRNENDGKIKGRGVKEIKVRKGQRELETYIIFPVDFDAPLRNTVQ